MKVFRLSHIDAINTAVHFDPSIQTSIEGMQQASGHCLQHFEDLGISKALLKRLEVWGLAKRGYTADKDGRKVRWVLINPQEVTK